MVWTCRAQHRLDCRSTQAECGCTEKIWQAKEIMGWSAWEWQKEARYGFCWPSESFWVERTSSRKTCQKAQPWVEENRALKWIWWWWWFMLPGYKWESIFPCFHTDLLLGQETATQLSILFYQILKKNMTTTLTLIYVYIWAASWQNQQNDCVPSKDSNQPGHPPSLIRVFAVR